MMRLLKYDWKKNSTMLLSTAVILILAEVGLTTASYTLGWEEGITIGLSIMLYVFTSMLAVIMTYRTFFSNAKSYSRRLLPVRTVWSVLSPMVLGSLVLIGLGILICIHIGVFSLIYGVPDLKDISTEVTSQLLKVTAIFVFQVFWAYLFSYMAIALSIAIALMFQRGRVWIGILSFIVIQNVISWIISSLFEVSFGGIPFLNVKLQSNLMVGGEVVFPDNIMIINWGETLLEAVFIVLMLYATVLLLNRRVEA